MSKKQSSTPHDAKTLKLESSSFIDDICVKAIPMCCGRENGTTDTSIV